MPEKTYWFFLEPDVYAAVKGDGLLLYNTLTGKFVIFNDNPRLVRFLHELLDPKNLYALEVSPEYMAEKCLQPFIDEVSSYFMGALIDKSLAPRKPFLMPPYLDIEDDSAPPARRTFKNVPADSIFTLKELTFYVNGWCDSNCTICHNDFKAFKQFPWCNRENGGSELSVAKIEDILRQTRGCPIKSINIQGGDLNLYSQLDQLVELLGSGLFQVKYYFHLSHLKNGLPSVLTTEDSRTEIYVMVDTSSNSDPFAMSRLKKIKPRGLVFLIQGDEDFPILEKYVDELGGTNFSVHPYYNGRNLDFFKENIFTDLESLSENILDIEMIKARGSRNTLKYGKMFIRNDKSIYSDINGRPLGKVGDISMEAAVVSELTEHGNWLLTRRHVMPCHNCLLSSICPPLSNFEAAVGINNSCKIWQDGEGMRMKIKRSGE